MSTNIETLTAFLDSIIDEYKKQAMSIGNIAKGGNALDPRSIRRLVQANARALAALNLKDALIDARIDGFDGYNKSEVLRRIQCLMDSEFGDPEAEMATVKLYSEVRQGIINDN